MNHTYILDKDALIYAPLSVFSLVIEHVPRVNSGSNAYGFVKRDNASCGSFHSQAGQLLHLPDEMRMRLILEVSCS